VGRDGERPISWKSTRTIHGIGALQIPHLTPQGDTQIDFDFRRRLPPHTKIGDGAEKAEDVQEPQNHGDHHNPIQNALNGPLHRYVVVHQPEKYSNYDQDHHELN
jgi:hypothetical protein